MKVTGTIALVISTLLLLCNHLPAASLLPVGQSESQFIYDAARRSEISSRVRGFNFNVAPYNLDEIGFEWPPFSSADRMSDHELSAFTFLSEDFRSVKYARGEGFESLRAGITAKPLDNLFVYSNLLLDEAFARDPEYTGKKWHGVAGEVETAMVSYSAGRFNFLMGRFASFWGPGTESLILSCTGRPMDAFSLRFAWGRVHFTYQHGKLDRLTGSSDSVDVFENRYFAGHRIDLRLLDNLNIGLSETIIYGGDGRNIELSYLNPLLFFHAVQLNENVDDNTILCFDVSYYHANRHKLYAQLLVDDYQIDDEEAADDEPDEIGYLIGLHSLNLFNLFDLKAEYLKIANRIYNQKLERNRYDNRGELIGHNFGPDGDLIKLSVIRWFESSKKVCLNFAYKRKGEGSYDDEWSEPWLATENVYSEPFPTGVVEKQYRLSIQFSGFYNRYAFVDFESGLKLARNFGHSADDNRSIPFLAVRFSLLFSKILNIS